ncbi:MAG TPA: hypothetical protein VK588_06375, partial [Chitinophagaceae bacterium]|nr:hypothetical protein [Chitinophagaceae bacterium]
MEENYSDSDNMRNVARVGIRLIALLIAFILFAVAIIQKTHISLGWIPKIPPALIGFSGVFIGAFLANYLAAKRDKRKAQRDLIKDMIEIEYRILLHLVEVEDSLQTGKSMQSKESKLMWLKIVSDFKIIELRTFDLFRSMWIRAGCARMAGILKQIETIFKSESLDSAMQMKAANK